MIEITVRPRAPALGSSASTLLRAKPPKGPPPRKGAMSFPRVLVCCSLVTLVGCELPIHPRDGSAVVQILVAPDSVALDPSQTQRFVAAGRTAGGDSMAGCLTWTTIACSTSPTQVSTASTRTPVLDH